MKWPKCFQHENGAEQEVDKLNEKISVIEGLLKSVLPPDQLMQVADATSDLMIIFRDLHNKLGELNGRHSLLQMKYMNAVMYEEANENMKAAAASMYLQILLFLENVF
jgi:hypothetical protein